MNGSNCHPSKIIISVSAPQNCHRDRRSRYILDLVMCDRPRQRRIS
ncbi:MAG: hypothetical protein ACOYMQ_03490 [Pseudanabaena sp.]